MTAASLRTTLLFVALLFSLAGSLVRGQTSSISSEARQEILNYQLTLPKANQLIEAMEAMTKYVVSLPDFQDRLAKAAKMPPAERRAILEKDPKAMAIVKQHGLTAQEYLVGVPTLRMALMAAQGLGNNQYITASPANVAFAKANLAQLKPKMDAADGIATKK